MDLFEPIIDELEPHINKVTDFIFQRWYFIILGVLGIVVFILLGMMGVKIL